MVSLLSTLILIFCRTQLQNNYSMGVSSDSSSWLSHKQQDLVDQLQLLQYFFCVGMYPELSAVLLWCHWFYYRQRATQSWGVKRASMDHFREVSL